MANLATAPTTCERSPKSVVPSIPFITAVLLAERRIFPVAGTFAPSVALTFIPLMVRVSEVFAVPGPVEYVTVIADEDTLIDAEVMSLPAVKVTEPAPA